MKKHIRSAVLLAFALCVVVVIGAVSAYAAMQSVTGTGSFGGTNVGTLNVQTSNKVQLCYNTGTTSSQSYSAGGDHKAGSKMFGTGSKASIYYKTTGKTAGVFYSCAGDSSLGTSFSSSGWTAQ